MFWSNRPGRRTKGSCIMSWPGHVSAGSVCNQIASTIDIFPTLAHIINAPLPKKIIDGVNISSLMSALIRKQEHVDFLSLLLMLFHALISLVGIGVAGSMAGLPGQSNNYVNIQVFRIHLAITIIPCLKRWSCSDLKYTAMD